MEILYPFLAVIIGIPVCYLLIIGLGALEGKGGNGLFTMVVLFALFYLFAKN